jgi:hypothetical protein
VAPTSLPARRAPIATPLRRVLRGLVNSGILDEGEDGRFALTELGEPLRADAPGSLRALVLLTGAQEYRAWGELLHTTRTGQTAFERAYGELFFARLDHDPAIGAHFDAFMDRVSARIAAALPAAYDFSPFRSVVDVGGGRGTLLAALLAAYPRLHGTLFDRAAVLSDVPQALVTAGVTARCQVVAGDFFQAVPAGGDLYILSQVLHDWNDARRAHPVQLPPRYGDDWRALDRRAHHAGARRPAGTRRHERPAHAHADRRTRAHRGGVPRAARRVRLRAHAGHVIGARVEHY